MTGFTTAKELTERSRREELCSKASPCPECGSSEIDLEVTGVLYVWFKCRKCKQSFRLEKGRRKT